MELLMQKYLCNSIGHVAWQHDETEKALYKPLVMRNHFKWIEWVIFFPFFNIKSTMEMFCTNWINVFFLYLEGNVINVINSMLIILLEQYLDYSY